MLSVVRVGHAVILISFRWNLIIRWWLLVGRFLIVQVWLVKLLLFCSCGLGLSFCCQSLFFCLQLGLKGCFFLLFS